MEASQRIASHFAMNLVSQIAFYWHKAPLNSRSTTFGRINLASNVIAVQNLPKLRTPKLPAQSLHHLLPASVLSSMRRRASADIGSNGSSHEW